MARMGGGRVLPQYTPFFAKGMEGLGQAMGSRKERQIEEQKNKVASRAWMGDPTAMQELAAMDPDMAMEVEDQVGKRQARERQTQLHTQAQEDRTLKLEDRQRNFSKENKELLDSFMVDAGGFDTYEMAAEYTADQIGQLEAIMGPEAIPEKFKEPLPPELYEQMKKMRQIVTGDDWEKSGGTTLEMGPDGKPRRVQAFVNPKTRETEVVPASIGVAITGHDPELIALKEQAKIKAKEEETRVQSRIAGGIDAAQKLPDINRALELTDRVATSGLKEDINALAQYVGYEGEETADLAELQQLLAVQMFEVLSNFPGSISSTELDTAKALSTGLGKNTEANRRRLLQLQAKLVRSVDMGREFATSEADMKMLADFDPYAASAARKTGGAAGGGEGTSQDNPLPVSPGAAQPPSGTWVRLPSGTVTQVP